jgi:voltage-gated potassium channel
VIDRKTELPAAPPTLPDTHEPAPTPASSLRARLYLILERTEPGDTLARLVTVALVVLIALSVLAVVLESIEPLYQRYWLAFWWFEIASVAVFTVEYLLRVWVSVEAPEAARDRHPLRTRLRYIGRPSALIDLVAIMPFFLMMLGVVGTTDMRFLRAVRLLRVLKLTRYSAAFDNLLLVFRENARSFAAAFFILIVVMLVAATGMYYFEHDAQPEAFSSIPASMWWAFVTLTTVGYGDITPVTAGGKVFGALMTVVGVGMVALPTGILASAYTEQLRARTEEYRQQTDFALEDGLLTEEEVRELEHLREALGLGRSTAGTILRAGQTRATRRIVPGGESFSPVPAQAAPPCPHCGAASSPDQQATGSARS